MKTTSQNILIEKLDKLRQEGQVIESMIEHYSRGGITLISYDKNLNKIELCTAKGEALCEDIIKALKERLDNIEEAKREMVWRLYANYQKGED